MRTRPPRVPGFALGLRLGGGTTAEVYAANHLTTGRHFALKILRDDLRNDPTNIALFRREGEIGMSVRHRHLLRVYNADDHCIVSERLPGDSLRTVLKQSVSLPVEFVLRFGRQLAGAISAMHEQGFIHGDIKPDNLHCLDGVTIKLLDFGYSHLPGENGKLLGEGFVLGTANYIAPELCEARPQEGFFNDVFSFGVTLFEMLVGELPYRKGPVEDTMLRHRDEMPSQLANQPRFMRLPLAHLIDLMLTRDPNERISMSQVKEELNRLDTSHRRSAA